MDHYLIDTNVLLRSSAPFLAEHRIASDSLAELALRGNRLYIAPQVVVEFRAVATRPVNVNGLGWPAAQAMDELTKILDEFPLLGEKSTAFELWLGLVRQYAVVGKSAHDAKLVAFMASHGLTHLLTFNKAHFSRYDLHLVSPAEVVATP